MAGNVLDKLVWMLDCDPTELTVAFIPTAADPYEFVSFLAGDRIKLKQLGFKIVDINIAGKSEKKLREKLKDVDIIFVAGGNTFYLLEKTLESGFDKVVREHVAAGKWYVGSSAGSALVGASIEPLKILDDPRKAPNLKSFEGLKLVNKIILPHYGNPKYKEKMRKILRKHADMKEKIILLTDNQAAVVINGRVKIISGKDHFFKRSPF